jgi:glycosyltransferase involved in cell wall biosynthesis
MEAQTMNRAPIPYQASPPSQLVIDRSVRPRTWLVIPAYNEEDRLDATVTNYLSGLHHDDRLLVMVNGSVDRTEEIAMVRAGEDSRVRVLVEPGRVGKGGALLTALRFLAAHADPADVVCYVDADGAVSPSQVARLCENVGASELRVGSRWMGGAVQVRRQGLLRRVASRVFNRCVHVAVRLDLADTQCAAKAIRAANLSRVVGRIDSPGFAFDIDLILAAREAGVICREEPITWEDHDGSTVRLRRDGPAMLRELLRLRAKYAATSSAIEPVVGNLFVEPRETHVHP